MRIAWRPCLAELIGTFALCFIGAGAICTDAYTEGALGLVGIAIAHGLVLSIVVSATGHISGGHINPAVTCAFLATGRMGWGKGLQYVVSQLAGAALAGYALLAVFTTDVWADVNLGTPALSPDISQGTGIFIEAILTFFLVFAVFGTAVHPNAPKIGGFGIGLTIAFNILMAGPLTGASMNPARTFGPGLAAGFWDGHIVYWIGPLLGGVIAGLLYDKYIGK